MEDMLIKGTGNSRWLKSVANIMTLYPTYESFAEALAAGTFPIDLNGINPAGVETAGTKLNKANLLSDETAATLGNPQTPDGALIKLYDLTKVPAVGSLVKVVLNTSGTWIAPSNVVNNLVSVTRIGGGGGGGQGGSSNGNYGGAGGGGGGGAGQIRSDVITITPGTTYQYEIGSGGASNQNGGSTKFVGLDDALGGSCGDGGGITYYNIGGAGGAGKGGGGAGGRGGGVGTSTGDVENGAKGNSSTYGGNGGNGGNGGYANGGGGGGGGGAGGFDGGSNGGAGGNGGSMSSAPGSQGGNGVGIGAGGGGGGGGAGGGFGYGDSSGGAGGTGSSGAVILQFYIE